MTRENKIKENEKELLELSKELGFSCSRFTLAPDNEKLDYNLVLEDVLRFYRAIKNKDKSIVKVFSTEEYWDNKMKQMITK